MSRWMRASWAVTAVALLVGVAIVPSLGPGADAPDAPAASADADRGALPRADAAAPAAGTAPPGGPPAAERPEDAAAPQDPAVDTAAEHAARGEQGLEEHDAEDQVGDTRSAPTTPVPADEAASSGNGGDTGASGPAAIPSSSATPSSPAPSSPAPPSAPTPSTPTPSSPTPTTPSSPGDGRLTDPYDGLVVGAHVHAMWSHYDDDLRARVLDELAAAGVRSIRVDIGWTSLMETCRGCISDWYVNRLDRVVTQAEARGMDVLGVLWRTPWWANAGDLLAPPLDAADYGDAAGWLAERFAGRIVAWELWNEPNLADYFHGTMDDYVELVHAASPAIRAADPSATIVLGGTAHNDSLWLSQILRRGVAPLVDAVAVHPYPAPSDDPPTLPDPDGDIGRFAHLATVIDVVERYAPGTPVWLTEFGWSSHVTEPGAPTWRRGVTREQQAEYAVNAIVMLRGMPAVERAYWFRALDRQTGNLHLDNFGLLDVDAQPKPVARELGALLAP